MKVKVFTIRTDPNDLTKDEQLLNDFLENVVLKKSSTQFVEEEKSHWSVLIHYEEHEHSPRLDRKSFEDLTPKDQQLYIYLKQWRSEKSEKLRLKNFMICHNSELLDIALYKPSNRDELKQIKGFGERKADKYGDDILAILNAV
jgi:superfamily II DNA helicase RecQ